MLEIDLGTAWRLEEYSAALAYIQANQFIWGCLQVARVENREVIEDMILKAPSFDYVQDEDNE